MPIRLCGTRSGGADENSASQRGHGRVDEAAEADRVVVMDKGKVIIEGIPRDVFSHVETMKKIGLDVPQVTEICYELRKAGIDIDTKILNVNEMVSALCQLK